MEKKIELIMQNTRDIDIYINGEIKQTIPSKNRKINAEDIYTLLDYHNGDKYIIVSKNEEAKDEKVIKFFSDLLSDIVKKICG